jgi:hypothetical protein
VNATIVAIAGGFLVLVGCLFVLAGLVKFCVDMYVESRPRGEKKGFAADDPSKWADLITAVGKLPPFAMSAVLGIVLIVAGLWILEGHTPVG